MPMPMPMLSMPSCVFSSSARLQGTPGSNAWRPVWKSGKSYSQSQQDIHVQRHRSPHRKGKSACRWCCRLFGLLGHKTCSLHVKHYLARRSWRIRTAVSHLWFIWVIKWQQQHWIATWPMWQQWKNVKVSRGITVSSASSNYLNFPTIFLLTPHKLWIIWILILFLTLWYCKNNIIIWGDLINYLPWILRFY